jgi:hypothetical protein
MRFSLIVTLVMLVGVFLMGMTTDPPDAGSIDQTFVEQDSFTSNIGQTSKTAITGNLDMLSQTATGITGITYPADDLKLSDLTTTRAKATGNQY